MIRMSLKADPELQVRGSLSDTLISAHWDPEQRAQSSDLHTCELMSRCCCKLLLNFLWFMKQQRKQKHLLLPEKAAETLSDTPIASRGDRGQDLLFENWNTHLEIIHGSKKKITMWVRKYVEHSSTEKYHVSKLATEAVPAGKHGFEHKCYKRQGWK